MHCSVVAAAAATAVLGAFRLCLPWQRAQGGNKPCLATGRERGRAFGAGIHAQVCLYYYTASNVSRVWPSSGRCEYSCTCQRARPSLSAGVGRRRGFLVASFRHLKSALTVAAASMAACE